MIPAADGVLGQILLTIETRPRWFEPHWHGISRQEGRVVAFPFESAGLDRGVTLRGNVVGPSGRTLVAAVRAESASSDDTSALVLTDLTQSRVVDLGFSRPGGGRLSLDYAVSLDDLAVAVTSNVVTKDPSTGAPRSSSTLSVLRGPDLRSVVERELNYVFVRGNNVNLQWSPDGRHLAATVLEPGRAYNSLQVLDARTLDVVLTAHTSWLLGSLSWSPDSSLLAVVHHSRASILHLPTQQIDALPWLPENIVDPPRAPELLGLMSGDRALVMRQTRRRTRISAVDIATGSGKELAALPLTDKDYRAVVNLTRQWEAVI